MKYILLTAFTFLLLLNTPPNVGAEEVWRITSLSWPPYSGKDIPGNGNSIARLRDILKKHDIRLEVEFYPWERAKRMAQQNKYVGYFPAWPEEVREGFIASPPVDWSEIGAVTNGGARTEWNGIRELFNYRVGVVETYDYPAYIQSRIEGKHKFVDEAPNEISLLRKLHHGIIDIAITDPSVLSYLSNKHKLSHIRVIKVFESKPLVIAFREGSANRERLKRFIKMLDADKASSCPLSR